VGLAIRTEYGRTHYEAERRKRMAENNMQDEQNPNPQAGSTTDTDTSLAERQDTWLKSLLTEYFDEQLKKGGAAPVRK
jgi:hypothetical protein